MTRRNLLKEPVRPVDIVVARPRTNQLQVHPIPRNPARKPPELRRILLGRKVPPAAPALVPHTPVPHIQWLRKPRRRPRLGQGRTPRRRVAVLHPVVKVERRQAPQIRRQIRLRPRQPAKPHKLVRPKLIRLNHLRPLFVQPRRVGIDLPEVRPPRPFRRRANPVLPVVAVRKAPARPANDRHMNLLQLFDEC